MSTPETKTAYLDNILLEMFDLSDHFEKSIVRYLYPYVDGADLEDLGEKDHTLKIRCLFYDNASRQTYDNHLALLKELKKKSDFVLLHPSYGALSVKVDSVDVRQDDRLRTAEVDLALVENGLAAIEPAPASAVDFEVESSFSSSEDEQEALVSPDMAGSGLDPMRTFVPGQPLVDQIAGVAPQARAYARQIDSALGYLSAYAIEVTQPVNSLVATINYAVSIPGRILGTVDQCVERVARLYDGINSFPARFLASVQFGLAKVSTDLDGFLPADRSGAKAMLLKHLNLAASRRLALETAYVYAADSAARASQKTQGAVQAFDTMGRFTPRVLPDVEPLNANELEDTLAASRTLMQSSITAARSMQSLKDMALQLQTSVSAVKMTAEQIVTIVVDGPTPLHVVCLQYGLPYTDAERIMALNPGLRNPTAASGTLQIYSYPGGAA